MPTEHDLSQWLGEDSRGVPYHLHLLSLMWSEEGVEHDLAVYRSVAERLRAEPEFWASCLRGAWGWRPTLVGCACLILSGERGFAAELRTAFQQGSMVQPQIAVTLGLLHPEEARSFFQSFLDKPESRGNVLGVVSAQRVLERLGVLTEAEVEIAGWPILEQDQATLANEVAIRHWTFWSAFA